MSKRQAIYIPGFAHKNPVPAAAKIGNVVYSGGIHGLDPETGETAETLEEQVALMFRHVASVVEAAGGTTSDIVKMTVWLRDRALRPVVNTHWLEMFPDPENRPARHTMRGNLDGNMQVQCDFVAVLDK